MTKNLTAAALIAATLASPATADVDHFMSCLEPWAKLAEITTPKTEVDASRRQFRDAYVSIAETMGEEFAETALLTLVTRSLGSGDNPLAAVLLTTITDCMEGK